MQFSLKERSSVNAKKFLRYFCIGSLASFISTVSFAETIQIKENQIINKSTQYKHATLNLTHGGFTIKQGGSLDIEDSVINVNISPSTPFFTHLTGGTLTLKNDTFIVTVTDIDPTPNAPSLYDLIRIDKGQVGITANSFTIDTPFTVGLVATTLGFTTDGFVIKNNSIKNFHGGLYLVNSDNAKVTDNTFENVSSSNIFSVGKLSQYKGNVFSFPGNLVQGDAIDIVNSSDVNVSDNIIGSSSSYGIMLTGAQNVSVTNNKITDGLSYGIFIKTASPSAWKQDKYLMQLMPNEKFNYMPNNNIEITNNFLSQNRYGLAAEIVDVLTVKNNMFIQRFANSASRQVWTNNDRLLASATNVTWEDNEYKEAFTQEVPGDNLASLRFVTYPSHGGVVLP